MPGKHPTLVQELLHGKLTDQPSLLSTALRLAPPFLPTTVGFLCPHDLEPQTPVWSLSPGHLQEHMGGKLDCLSGSRKYDLLEWFDGESCALWKLQEVLQRASGSCLLMASAGSPQSWQVRQVAIARPSHWTDEESETLEGQPTSPRPQSWEVTEAGHGSAVWHCRGSFHISRDGALRREAPKGIFISGKARHLPRHPKLESITL